MPALTQPWNKQWGLGNPLDHHWLQPLQQHSQGETAALNMVEATGADLYLGITLYKMQQSYDQHLQAQDLGHLQAAQQIMNRGSTWKIQVDAHSCIWLLRLGIWAWLNFFSSTGQKSISLIPRVEHPFITAFWAVKTCVRNYSWQGTCRKAFPFLVFIRPSTLFLSHHMSASSISCALGFEWLVLGVMVPTYSCLIEVWTLCFWWWKCYYSQSILCHSSSTESHIIWAPWKMKLSQNKSTKV